MSECISFFLVDLPTVQNACGSKDLSVWQTICENEAEDIADFDENNESEIESGEVRPLSDSLRDLIMGEHLKYDIADSGIAAFQLLCRHFGEQEWTEGFVDFHPVYLDEVDKGLKAIGLSELISTGTLLQRGLPENVPVEVVRSTSVGYVLPNEVAPILEKIGGDTGCIHDVEGIDQQIAAGIEELLELLLMASKAGKTLVTFG